MFAAESSPQRQIGSPQSNYASCFQMQICYQINKATKDANREIRAARLASVGRKKKSNISIKASPRVFSVERTDLYVFV